MRVKKIIPLFVVFAMVTSLLSVPAHATYGGGVGRADLWEWTYGLYQSGNTDFNPGGIYGGGGGRDDLSAAYSSYVSTLPSSGVTSSGLPVYYPSDWSYSGSDVPPSYGVLSSSCGGFSFSCLTQSSLGRVQYGFKSSDFFLYPGSYLLYLDKSSNLRNGFSLYKDNLAIACRLDVGSTSFTVSYGSYFRCEGWGPLYGSLSSGVDISFSAFGHIEAVSLLDPSSYVSPESSTRPTSISGNYGIIGDDGQLTSVGTQTIVNEGSSTYYNPVTSTTYDLSGWTYDYSTRTYDLSTTSGDTITVEYADESVNITEGDTVYNVYYVVEQEPVDPSTCEHTYTCEHTTLPSCTQAGLDTYTCSLCGDIYTQTVAAVGHAWTVKQSVNTQYDENGSLVTEGYTIYECSTCGEQYKSTDGTSPPNSSGSSSGGAIGGLLESLISGFGSIVGGLISGLLSLLTKAVEALGGIGDLLSALWDSLGSIFDGFTGFLAVVFPFLPEEFLTILEFGFILLVGAGIIKKFSS